MEEKEYVEESGITLGDIFHTILKNFWLAVIITLSITLLGAIYTFFIAKPTYKATSTVVVAITDDSGDKLDYGNSSKLMYTIQDLVKQDIVLGDVAKANDLDSKVLTKNVEVKANSNSYLINIAVLNGNKDLAVKLTNELVQELIKEIDTNEVFAFAKGSVKVTSKAEEAKYDSPNKTMFLIVSFVLGGVVAVAYILIKELASNKYKNKKEIESQFKEKVIGTLFDESTKEQRELEKKGQKVVNLVTPSIRSFEPYNKLLANIKYSNIENPYKVIMLSATGMNELKSTTCANLAYCMVNNDKKAVVIDLDTRKPVLHKTFKVSKEQGLVDYIEGAITKDELIKHSESGVDVITAGKKVINPMVIIESNAVKDLIEELRKEYDYILLDTPPMLSCSDAIAVSKLADGVVFNIAMNQSKKNDIKEAIKSLREVETDIIGLNLTKVELSKKDARYYYYED